MIRRLAPFRQAQGRSTRSLRLRRSPSGFSVAPAPTVAYLPKGTMNLPVQITSMPPINREPRGVIRAANAGLTASTDHPQALGPERSPGSRSGLAGSTPWADDCESRFPMPTLSKFYGIRISVRTSELNHPLPHFHAHYAEFEASISLDPLQVLAGTLPRRAMDLTLLWAGQHRAELLAAWQAIQEGRTPNKIAPLE